MPQILFTWFVHSPYFELQSALIIPGQIMKHFKKLNQIKICLYLCMILKTCTFEVKVYNYAIQNMCYRILFCLASSKINKAEADAYLNKPEQAIEIYNNPN